MVVKFIITSFSIFILLTACTENEYTNSNNLIGTWVETEFKTDTIRFDSQSDFFWLIRGFEFINGYDLPKVGSGPYSYKIENDSIFLNSLISSLAVYKPYYFNADGNNLVIGNFYDENQEKKLLTFTRLY